MKTLEWINQNDQIISTNKFRPGVKSATANSCRILFLSPYKQYRCKFLKSQNFHFCSLSRIRFLGHLRDLKSIFLETFNKKKFNFLSPPPLRHSCAVHYRVKNNISKKKRFYLMEKRNRIVLRFRPAFVYCFR